MPLQAPRPALPASQRSLIESMPFPVFIRGRDNRYLACNRLFQDFIGHGEDEVVGRTATELAGAEMARIYDMQCAEVWVEGRPLSHDAVVRRADGALRQMRFHRSILRADDGGVVGLIGVMEDVTEERQANAALAESEARFSRLAELTAEGVVLYADGVIIDVNDAMVRMLGWPREHLVGRHYSVLLTSENLKKAACCVEDRAAGSCRTELARADGSIVPVEIRSRAVTHGGQDMRVATVTDISSRLAAEQALRERELLYRQMFENNQVVKLLIDPDSGQIVDANPAAALFYGWSVEQLRLRSITHINALPAEQVKAEMALARSEARNFFRFRHRTARGDVKQVEVFSGPCHFHGRSLLHSIVIDVTARERAVVELRRKSEALELSNADLQQFAYVASHDLQEPLRSVVSYLQLLQRRYQGKLDAEADEFIGFAVNGAKRMSALIQDLLLYSRVDAQGHPLEPVECDEVMASTLANLHFLLEAMEATVEVSGPLPRVLGDAPQLSSVLQNLIGNAVKYRHRERKPHIRISAEPGETGEWVFSVTDNGIGIDPEYHDRIFMIFQRLHTQTEYPGTGIGLALVRRIICRHGGRIWVENQPEGQDGATFRFTLQGAWAAMP